MSTLVFGPDIANLHEIEYIGIGNFIRYRQKQDTIWYYVRPEQFLMVLLDGFSTFDRMATASLVVEGATGEVLKNRYSGNNSIFLPHDFLDLVDRYMVEKS